MRLPRKVKRYYKRKLNITDVISLNELLCEYNWKFKRRYVMVRAMSVIINYPNKATKTELIEYYTKNYPNDKESLHYAKQI